MYVFVRDGSCNNNTRRRRRYCAGVVDSDNRTRQHSSWRRILLEAFDQQCRDRLVLQELQAASSLSPAGSPMQSRRKKRGKRRSKKSKKQKKTRSSRSRSPSPSRGSASASGSDSDSDGSAAGVVSPSKALGRASAPLNHHAPSSMVTHKRTSMPAEVERALWAADCFAESPTVRCMTTLHELENLHRYLRRQLSLFDSDLKAQVGTIARVCSRLCVCVLTCVCVLSLIHI